MDIVGLVAWSHKFAGLIKSKSTDVISEALY
jgi:hypothetical protein